MQSADAKKVIDRFTKESGYEFLSNFYPSTISHDGRLYPTVEHAYQASKTHDPQVKEMIRLAKDPSVAKKLGQAIPIRPDWQDVKLSVMRSLIHEKFQNPFLRPLLLATEETELILNNKWNDKFWGICRGIGENWLGKILMEERNNIKEEQKLSFP